MNSFAAYNAIDTKLHTRRRAFLNKADWNKIIECNKVTQVIEFLQKKYGYSHLIGEQKVQDMHRGELEVVLNRYLVVEIEKMIHYFSGHYKDFFKIFLMTYEIYDLQLILRAIARNENMEAMSSHFIHSEKYTTLSYNKLVGCGTVEQFVEGLKGSIYYDALKTMTQEDAIKREFHMEMRLNILFYRLLMEKAKKLNKKDAKIVEDVIGVQIDYYNIQWIYRATKYYDISKEEILIYSLPKGNKLSFSRLKKLIYTKTLEEFKALADKYVGQTIFKQNDDIFLERDMEAILYDIIHPINVSNSIAMPLVYIYTLTIQIKDLIGVTEGIRYGLPKEEIKKYLVYTI